MTQLLLNLGAGVNTRDGDKLRTAAQKINDNFTDLYSQATTVASQVAALQVLNTTINAKTYGAVGNGVTNDTAAIQAALTAAAATAVTAFGRMVVPGICYLPAGIYPISAPLVLPEKTILRGAGPTATTIAALTS